MNKEKFKSLLKVNYPKGSVRHYLDKRRYLDTKIPIFAPRSIRDRNKDKYDKDFEYVDRYTGLFSFAHVLFGHGGAEGLYRTINSALLSNLDRNIENTVLDIGCGVGRTLYDCADLFPNTLFVGMDYAYKMCIRAKQIVIEGKVIPLTKSLSHTGLKQLVPRGTKIDLRKTKKAKNVFIAQGSVMELPFEDNSFDCVINTYLIDRAPNPESAIIEMIRVLKRGGLFILSDPLNYEKADSQKIIPNVNKLKKVLSDNGIKIIESFDRLIYREVKDIRGNYTDFLSFVYIGNKR